MSCPEFHEPLEARVEGLLAGDEAERVQDHLVRCAPCRGWEARLLEEQGTLRRILNRVSSRPSRRFFRRGWLVQAACVAAFLVSVAAAVRASSATETHRLRLQEAHAKADSLRDSLERTREENRRLLLEVDRAKNRRALPHPPGPEVIEITSSSR